MTITLGDIWPVVVSFLFSYAWLIRLEAKVLNMEKQNNKTDKLLDQMKEKLDSISESLARLEGKLEYK